MKLNQESSQSIEIIFTAEKYSQNINQGFWSQNTENVSVRLYSRVVAFFLVYSSKWSPSSAKK